MSSALGERAWVFVMKSDGERSWAANRGYDDSAGIYYSYDSNVGNCKRAYFSKLAQCSISIVAACSGCEHIHQWPASSIVAVVALTVVAT